VGADSSVGLEVLKRNRDHSAVAVAVEDVRLGVAVVVQEVAEAGDDNLSPSIGYRLSASGLLLKKTQSRRSCFDCVFFTLAGGKTFCFNSIQCTSRLYVDQETKKPIE